MLTQKQKDLLLLIDKKIKSEGVPPSYDEMKDIEGESMINAGILDGDIVIVKKANTARNNQIVVALVDQEEATLKRLYKSSQGVELIAENPDFPTRTFGPDRVEVQGILVGLVRKYH